MQRLISVEEKGSFINKFLGTYKLKQQGAVWLLKYLEENINLLQNIHFVRDAKYCPRAMILSTICSGQIPFLFYKDKVITEDPEKLFHDIRLNPNDALYVQVNVDPLSQVHFHKSVLVDNPYTPFYSQQKMHDLDCSEQLLKKLQHDFLKESLRKQIDESLDKKDKEKFFKLSEVFDQFLKQEYIKG